MGEKRGGPMGVGTQSVRLDPPQKEVPLGDEGEEHAAAVLKAAKSAQASISDAPPAESEKEAGTAREEWEKLKKEQDDAFMADYDLNMNELILTGRVSHLFKIADTCEFGIQTLTEEENIQIEAELTGMINSEERMAASHVSANIRRHLLARAIRTMNGQEFGTDVAERFQKIGPMSGALILHIHTEYRKLNKAVSILLTGSSGNSLERLLIGQEPL